MKSSPNIAAYLRRRESLRLTAYLDGGGVPTIGYGSTRGVRLGMTITEAEAAQRFADDVAEAEDGVTRYVAVPLTQNQFDALTSLVFNIGVGHFASSTLLVLVNAGDPTAPAEFARWCFDNGKFVKGLLDRRVEELGMYLKP